MDGQRPNDEPDEREIEKIESSFRLPISGVTLVFKKNEVGFPSKQYNFVSNGRRKYIPGPSETYDRLKEEKSTFLFVADHRANHASERFLFHHLTG